MLAVLSRSHGLFITFPGIPARKSRSVQEFYKPQDGFLIVHRSLKIVAVTL